MNQDRLGLGTAALAALDDRKAIWRLLDAALEAGIRHFDTARLYGDGIMERTLSPFIKANRASIIITTKFGLNGRWKGALPARLLPPARKLAKSLAGHGKKQSDAHPARSYEPPFPHLNTETMRSSLETSLRELGVDRVDIFLMHEARTELVTNELLLALEHEKMSGKIGSYGAGGEWTNTMGLASLDWPSQPILQAPTSLTLSDREPIHLGAPPDIIHSVFRGMPYLESAILQHNLGESFPGGPIEPGVTLPILFLQWAMMRYPESRILFGSRSVKTIQSNALVAAAPIFSRLLEERLEWLRQHDFLSSASK